MLLEEEQAAATYTADDFTQFAAKISQNLSTLLHAEVVVVDQQDRVIASNAPGRVGLPLASVSHTLAADPLRFPFGLNGQEVTLVVYGLAPDEASAAQLAQTIIQLVVEQSVLAAQAPRRSDLKKEFIYDLLHGARTDEAAVRRQANALGLDLVPPRAVILIDATGYILDGGQWSTTVEAQIERRAYDVIDSVIHFFHLPNDTICTYMGQGEVAILKASDTRNLAPWASGNDASPQANSTWANLGALKRAANSLLDWLRHDLGEDFTIGVGRHHPGIPGLARSYADARAALSLGSRFHGSNDVHCLDELGMAAFIGISDERTKLELATHLLSPLDDESELIDTLLIFFTNYCSPSAASSQLDIHRNTLSYRLDKITSLTGLDPRHFDDAVQIRLALLLRDLHS